MFLFDLPAGWIALLNPWWMPINYVLIAALLALAYLSFRRPAWGIAGVAFSLPLYLARSRLWFLPTTFLELAILAVMLGWVARRFFYPTGHAQPDPLRFPITALLVFGTIGMLVAPDLKAAAGLWRAYLVEPILLYALATRALVTERDRRTVVAALATSGAAVAMLTLWQQSSGVGIAEPGWVLPAQRRVTTFYTSPNAVGLYLAPILALVAGAITDRGLRWRYRITGIGIFALGLLAVNATYSAGTWLGMAGAGMAIAVQRWGGKRTALVTGAAVLLALVLPFSRQRIGAEFSDPAWQNRHDLWRGTVQYLTASPQHFLLGAGIHGFPVVQEAFRDPLRQEPLLYPHTIVLNFWMEYGLGGLLAVAWLAFTVVQHARQAAPKLRGGISVGALAALSAIAFHGLVDVPYFKNDLAALTWLLLALALPTRLNASAGLRPAIAPEKTRIQ